MVSTQQQGELMNSEYIIYQKKICLFLKKSVIIRIYRSCNLPISMNL